MTCKRRNRWGERRNRSPLRRELQERNEIISKQQQGAESKEVSRCKQEGERVRVGERVVRERGKVQRELLAVQHRLCGGARFHHSRVEGCRPETSELNLANVERCPIASHERK